MHKFSQKILSYVSKRFGTRLLTTSFILIFASVGVYFTLFSHAESNLTADFNSDSTVNIYDLSILATNWGKTSATNAQGDANSDGVVNIYDLSILASQWGQSATPTPTPKVTPTPTPSGPVYNVMDYGAKGDGTTDDAPAIHNAFDAADASNGGTVFFPSGKNYYISSTWNMAPIKTNDWLNQPAPTVHRTGTITMSGIGATIKYAPTFARGSWLTSGYPSPATNIWTTQGNLLIDGFTIDNNFSQSTGEAGRIVWLHDCNVENVTVKNVVMKNVNARTNYNSPGSTNGVFMKENFSTPTPGHRAFMRNITITDSTISAQAKPIFIGTDGYGQDTYGYGDSPMVVDNIDIERVHTDNNGHIGTGIHLGSYASGGTAKVIDVTCTNSSDNLIEVDAFNDVTVQNATLSKAQSGIGFTWFSFPYRSTTPTYRIYNVKYSGGNAPYWPLDVTTKPAARRNSEGSVFLGAVSGNGGTNLLGRSWGNMIMKGADLTNGEDNSFGIAQNAVKYGGAFESVDIEDVYITDIDALNVGGSLLYIKQQGSNTLPITLKNINYRTTTNGSFQALPSSRMTLSGSYTLSP